MAPNDMTPDPSSGDLPDWLPDNDNVQADWFPEDSHPAEWVPDEDFAPLTLMSDLPAFPECDDPVPAAAPISPSARVERELTADDAELAASFASMGAAPGQVEQVVVEEDLAPALIAEPDLDTALASLAGDGDEPVFDFFAPESPGFDETVESPILTSYVTEAMPVMEPPIGAPPVAELSAMVDEPGVSIPEDGPDFLSDILPAIVERPISSRPTARRDTRSRSGVRHVVFTTGGDTYALPLESVREIARMPQTFPVPNTPTWLAGVTNLRGDVVSVVDLGAFLGLEDGLGRADRRLLAVKATREDVFVGLIVDRVNGIRDLGADRPELPARCAGALTPYISGVGESDGRMVVVLDADRLLLSPAMRQFERM